MNPGNEKNLDPEVRAIVELTIQEAVKYQNFLLQSKANQTPCCKETPVVNEEKIANIVEMPVPCCSAKAEICCPTEEVPCSTSNVDYKASKEYFKNTVLACLQVGVPMETIRGKVEESLSAMPQESWTKVLDKLASFERKAPLEASVAISADKSQDQLFNDLCQAVTNYGFGYLEKKLNPKEKKDEKKQKNEICENQEECEVENKSEKKEDKLGKKEDKSEKKDDKPGKKEGKALKKHIKEHREVINAHFDTIQAYLMAAGIDPSVLEKIAKTKDKEKKQKDSK